MNCTSEMELVGEYWPKPDVTFDSDVDDSPVRLREFPKAIWQMFTKPSAIGPRLANTSIAYAFVVLGVFCAILTAMFWAKYWLPVYLIVGTSALVVISAVAFLLMPLVYQGERKEGPYEYACRVVMWGFVYWIPWLLIIWGLAYLEVAMAPPTGEYIRYDTLDPNWFASVLLFVATLYVVFMTIRLSAAPASSAAKKPTLATCVRCHYRLQGLRFDGKCPECGLAVESSVPGNQPMVEFDAAVGFWRRFGAFWRTCWAARDPKALLIGKNLHAPTIKAQEFLFGVISIAMLLVAGEMVFAFNRWGWGDSVWLVLINVSAVVYFPAMVGIFELSVFTIIVFFSTFRLRKDPRPRVRALCYASANFIPTMILGGAFAYWNLFGPFSDIIGVTFLVVISVAAMFGLVQMIRAVVAVRLMP